MPNFIIDPDAPRVAREAELLDADGRVLARTKGECAITEAGFTLVADLHFEYGGQDGAKAAAFTVGGRRLTATGLPRLLYYGDTVTIVITYRLSVIALTEA